LVAYPSRYEGFGLPAVEAMACRAPLVASRIPPLVESLGDGAMLVPPGDVEGWSAMIRELLTDEDRRRELADRGHARASRLSWPAVADATVDLYRAAGLPL
jgi:glycosyltransferase involved in cell wall biosynthesis